MVRVENDRTLTDKDKSKPGQGSLALATGRGTTEDGQDGARNTCGSLGSRLYEGQGSVNTNARSMP